MTPKPLNCFCKGSTVRVMDIEGGCSARSRLLAMGLTPGCPVELMSDGCGPVRIKVRNSEVVLGQGLCDKVLVCESCGSPVCPEKGCKEKTKVG